MKICFCIDTMESGGAERVASILCNEFDKMGHDVVLLAVSQKEHNSFYNLSGGISFLPLLESYKARKRINHLTKIKELRRHFKGNKYDAIISFLPNVNTYVWLSSIGLKGIIHIASERNNPKTDPKNRIKRFFKEMAFRNADGMVFQTQEAMSYYSRRIKCKSKIIYNPVSIFYNPSNANQNNTIISVGRLESQKNFGLLIDAFYEFNSSHPDSILKIYGIGSQKQLLTLKIDELKLKEKVFLLGESKTWLKDNLGCAMFINSSLYEGMPNSLLEAMLSGIPCIASDCPIGGSKELLSYNNGLLFENGNKTSLINQMEILYHNKNMMNVFKNNNINIRSKFLEKNIATEWIDFISTVKCLEK